MVNNELLYWVCESAWRFEGKETTKKIYVNSFCSERKTFVYFDDREKDSQMFGNATHVARHKQYNMEQKIIDSFYFEKNFRITLRFIRKT